MLLFLLGCTSEKIEVADLSVEQKICDTAIKDFERTQISKNPTMSL